MTKITTKNATKITLSEEDMDALNAEHAVLVEMDDMMLVLRYEP